MANDTKTGTTSGSCKQNEVKMYTVAYRLANLINVVPPDSQITESAIVPEFEKYVIFSSIIQDDSQLTTLDEYNIHLFNDGSIMVTVKNDDHAIVINDLLELRFYVLKFHSSFFAKKFIDEYNRMVSKFLVYTECASFEQRQHVIRSICEQYGV